MPVALDAWLRERYAPQTVEDIPEKIREQVEATAWEEAKGSDARRNLEEVARKDERERLYAALRAHEEAATKIRGWHVLAATLVLAGICIAFAWVNLAIALEKIEGGESSAPAALTDPVSILLFSMSLPVSAGMLLNSALPQRWRIRARVGYGVIGVIASAVLLCLISHQMPDLQNTVLLGAAAMLLPVVIDCFTPKSEALSHAERQDLTVVPYLRSEKADPNYVPGSVAGASEASSLAALT
jgi:hypothetical protein